MWEEQFAGAAGPVLPGLLGELLEPVKYLPAVARRVAVGGRYSSGRRLGFVEHSFAQAQLGCPGVDTEMVEAVVDLDP